MIDLRNREIALSSIAAALIEPSWIFKEAEIPEEVLEENRKMQYKYGLDEADFFSVDYNGWIIHFRPDGVDDDTVYEFKVRRRFSNLDRLYAIASVQAFLAAHFLKKEKFRIVIYDYEKGTILIDDEYSMNDASIKSWGETILNETKNLLYMIESLETVCPPRLRLFTREEKEKWK